MELIKKYCETLILNIQVLYLTNALVATNTNSHTFYNNLNHPVKKKLSHSIFI